MTFSAARDTALRDVFGLDAFRPGQEEIIDAVLRGQPTVAVMPTGSGKSLCYQLPAVVSEGTALVVSPLIALMKDQVDALQSCGVAATSITSAVDASERQRRLKQMAAGDLDLVYVAPERFKSGAFLAHLGQIRDAISLLAVDEAHCISEWGHDFRPDYLRLQGVVEQLKPQRLVALTATATPEVREDIVARLGMDDPAVFVRGFDRPNLHFFVEQTHAEPEKADALVRWVTGCKSGSILVYAATRKNTEQYASLLKNAGVRVLGYHAGMGDDERTRVHDAFMSGEVQTVVATNAFGMGIDKEDVRLVVHADLPRSPEAYYQEVGRAGRDGQRSDVVLLFRHADVRLQEFLIETSTPSAPLMRSVWKTIRDTPDLGSDLGRLGAALQGKTRRAQLETAVRFLLRAAFLIEDERGLRAVRPGEEPGLTQSPIDAEALERKLSLEQNKLRSMVRYGYSSGCRRRYFLTYFGDEEANTFTRCTSCDTCLSDDRRTLTELEKEQVRAVLSAIEAARGLGRKRLAGFLTGAEDEPRLAGHPARGALSLTSQKYVMDLITALEGEGLVATARGEYPTLSITTLGQNVLAGEIDELQLPVPDVRKRRRKKKKPAGLFPDPELPEPDPELLDRLKTWRLDVAKSDGVPAYVVFNNKTLMALAQHKPTNVESLLQIPGIGPKKAETYGERILEVLQEAG